MNQPDDRRVHESPAHFDENRVRAAAVYCSDGRFGEHFDDFLHAALKLPRYDRLAVPGGAACLAGHFLAFREEEGMVEQLRFLVKVHGLERVVLIAHQDCAFYTERLHVSPSQLESQQRDDLETAAERVRSFASSLLVEAYFAPKAAGWYDPIRIVPTAVVGRRESLSVGWPLRRLFRSQDSRNGKKPLHCNGGRSAARMHLDDDPKGARPMSPSSDPAPAVVITGASTGIGEACALELDRRGFRVFAGVRSDAAAEKLEAQASSRLTSLLIDVTDVALFGPPPKS